MRKVPTLCGAARVVLYESEGGEKVTEGERCAEKGEIMGEGEAEQSEGLMMRV